jgi:tRNA A22 N-methylase
VTINKIRTFSKQSGYKCKTEKLEKGNKKFWQVIQKDMDGYTKEVSLGTKT